MRVQRKSDIPSSSSLAVNLFLHTLRYASSSIFLLYSSPLSRLLHVVFVDCTPFFIDPSSLPYQRKLHPPCTLLQFHDFMYIHWWCKLLDDFHNLLKNKFVFTHVDNFHGYCRSQQEQNILVNEETTSTSNFI